MPIAAAAAVTNGASSAILIPASVRVRVKADSVVETFGYITTAS